MLFGEAGGKAAVWGWGFCSLGAGGSVGVGFLLFGGGRQCGGGGFALWGRTAIPGSPSSRKLGNVPAN